MLTNPQAKRNLYYTPQCRQVLFCTGRYVSNFHIIDSEESARREMALFFPEFDCEHWYTHEEAQFRNGIETVTNNRGALY